MSWTPITAPFAKYTDFVGELYIPNLTPTMYDESDPPEIVGVEREVDDANIALLNMLIAKYEKGLFTALLGTTTYDAFIAALAGMSEPDTKWITLHGKLTANPVAASYTYYWWQRNLETISGGVGEAVPVIENATRTAAAKKAARAWNEMSIWVSELVTWLQANEADYQCQTNGVIFSDVLWAYRTINTFGI